MKWTALCSVPVTVFAATHLSMLAAPTGGEAAPAKNANGQNEEYRARADGSTLAQSENDKTPDWKCAPFDDLAPDCPTSCGNFVCTKDGAILVRCVAKSRCSQEGTE